MNKNITLTLNTSCEADYAQIDEWVAYNGWRSTKGIGVVSLMIYISKLKSGSKVYVQDLDYYGRFIVDYIILRKWVYFNQEDLSKVDNGGYSTLINQNGAWYNITLRINGKTIKIVDLSKKVPLSIEEMAVSYRADQVGVEGLEREAMIMYDVLNQHLELGYTSLTLSSDALNDYKKMIGYTRFKELYPVLDDNIDEEIRKSYGGAFTYKHKDESGPGFSIDINSMYSYILNTFPLPYGEPKVLTGDDIREIPLNRAAQFFKVKIVAVIKEGGLPAIRNNVFVNEEEQGWLEYIDETRVITMYDKLILEANYNIKEYKVIEQYVFKQTQGSFSGYINKHFNNKKKAKEENNKGLYTISKLLLNSLYGKFGQASTSVITRPVLNGGKVEYISQSTEKTSTVYVPLASYVTSIGRWLITSAALLNYDRLLYIDTDSIHLEGSIEDLVTGAFIKLDDEELGCYDIEYTFNEAKYLKQKFYALKGDDDVKIAAAGLLRSAKSDIIYEQFNSDLVVHEGLKRIDTVPGGAKITLYDFSLN